MRERHRPRERSSGSIPSPSASFRRPSLREPYPLAWVQAVDPEAGQEPPRKTRSIEAQLAGSRRMGSFLERLQAPRPQAEAGASGSGSERLPIVQAKTSAARAPHHSEPEEIQEAAREGISRPGATLPYLDASQRSLGRHDVSHMKAHTDAQAVQSTETMPAVVQRKIRVVGNPGFTVQDIKALDLPPLAKKVLKDFEEDEEDHAFESWDDVRDRLAAAMVHWGTSELLGTPVNKTVDEKAEHAKEIEAGNKVAWELLRDLKTRREAALGDESEAKNNYAWTVHRAAAATVLMAGVCDNFGSLSAVLLRMGGLDNIKVQVGHGHRWASVGAYQVDPWTDQIPADSKRAGDLQERQVLDEDPAKLEKDFNKEAETCAGLLKGLLSKLPAEKLTAYQALIEMRGQGGWGSVQMRSRVAQEQAEKNRRHTAQVALRAAEREAKQANAPSGKSEKQLEEERRKKQELLERRKKMMARPKKDQPSSSSSSTPQGTEPPSDS